MAVVEEECVLICWCGGVTRFTDVVVVGVVVVVVVVVVVLVVVDNSA